MCGLHRSDRAASGSVERPDRAACEQRHKHEQHGDDEGSHPGNNRIHLSGNRKRGHRVGIEPHPHSHCARDESRERDLDSRAAGRNDRPPELARIHKSQFRS